MEPKYEVLFTSQIMCLRGWHEKLDSCIASTRFVAALLRLEPACPPSTLKTTLPETYSLASRWRSWNNEGEVCDECIKKVFEHDLFGARHNHRRVGFFAI